MTAPTASAIPPDELRLAQLACGKLAGLVEGTLSIGVPALVSGVPAPRPFIETQFRILTGFAIVLNSVAAAPGGQAVILHLRENSGAVLAALETLESLLLEYLARPGHATRPLTAARAAALALCDAIADYAEQVQLDGSRVGRAKEIASRVFDEVERMIDTARPVVR
jgi:hypothetical protein